MKLGEYKYLIAALYAVALFMDLLDTTIVNVALPVFGAAFHAGTTTIEWVITGYLLSLAVFIPVSGWAGDRFGTKRVFLLALTVFTLGSLACGLASGIGTLILFRLLQGIGGGMLTPVGATMLYRAFPPHERARVSSLITVPAVVAPATGPVLGGYLLQTLGWRSVFWINAPVGLLAILIAGLTLREQREAAPGRFDLPGFLLGAAALSMLLSALAQAGDRGFGTPRVLGPGLLALTALIGFVAVELRTGEPMIDLRLFRDALFRAGTTVQLFGFGAQFGALFLLPLLLQSERGLTPLASGLTTFPQAIGVMTMAPIAGRVYVRVGPRRMALVGLSLAGLAMLGFLWVDLQTNEWWIRALMLLRGWGFALSLTAMQTATFATVSRASMGRGSAIYSVTRQVSTSLTVAVLATVLANGLRSHGAILGDPKSHAGALIAFHSAFAAAGLLALVAAALALLVNDRLAAGTMRRGPAEEERVYSATRMRAVSRSGSAAAEPRFSGRGAEQVVLLGDGGVLRWMLRSVPSAGSYRRKTTRL